MAWGVRTSTEVGGKKPPEGRERDGGEVGIAPFARAGGERGEGFKIGVFF